jgi:hypothetical protein
MQTIGVSFLAGVAGKSYAFVCYESSHGFIPNCSYNPLFVFGRRDVPAERLYKDMQRAEKGDIKPGFPITSVRYCELKDYW